MGQNIMYRMETSKELRSFVYQQISELENFFTENTQVILFADEFEPNKIILKIQDGEHFIEASGHDDNIFAAITDAKTSLLKKLLEIQDQVISASDRQRQISYYKNYPVLH